ncbi:MAG: family 20 glycosylhydrolase [Candidatus Sumerlaeota bacterium]|nr:family 20 glycosylhydrolase [Candidatus Sumerlaeota bacterium]
MKELLIPVRMFDRQPGRFHVPRTVTLSSVHAADALPLAQLRGDLAALKRSARVVMDAPAAAIVVRRDKSLPHPEEYRLRVTARGVEILSATAAGAYYGVQTLRDMIHAGGASLPCCRIEDWPAFARRGVYHDCSRGKVPKTSTVKQLVEWLAHWKINELQLYVENVFTFKKHPEIGRGFSPFTAADLLEIQEHCRLHHMRFVPSLTSFGHFEKILMLPEHAHLGEMPGFRDFPGGTTLCPGDPGAIRLVADMYREFVPLFEAEDFNVCGDEPWELGRGRSKRRADTIGVGRVYWEFMMKIRDLCLKHGKRMNMWGDIVLLHPEIIPEIPRDVVMLNWDYSPNGKRIPRTSEFAEAGLPLVCCPGTNGWQSHGTRLRSALGNVSAFARVGLENGAEGLLHTDWGDGGHRNFLGVSLCSFAHGAAHAWNSEDVDDGAHVRKFAARVFGDRDGRLAEALRILGADESANWSYNALVESLAEPKWLTRGVARRPVPPAQVPLAGEQLERRLQGLKAAKWPKPGKALAPFEAVALEEFPVAAEMERLAYQRALLARAVRSGKTPSAAVLRRHALEVGAMAKAFARLWNLRNRPSRLSDSLFGFQAAVREALRLAKRA